MWVSQYRLATSGANGADRTLKSRPLGWRVAGLTASKPMIESLRNVRRKAALDQESRQMQSRRAVVATAEFVDRITDNQLLLAFESAAYFGEARVPHAANEREMLSESLARGVDVEP